MVTCRSAVLFVVLTIIAPCTAGAEQLQDVSIGKWVFHLLKARDTKLSKDGGRPEEPARLSFTSSDTVGNSYAIDAAVTSTRPGWKPHVMWGFYGEYHRHTLQNDLQNKVDLGGQIGLDGKAIQNSNRAFYDLVLQVGYFDDEEGESEGVEANLNWTPVYVKDKYNKTNLNYWISMTENLDIWHGPLLELRHQESLNTGAGVPEGGVTRGILDYSFKVRPWPFRLGESQVQLDVAVRGVVDIYEDNDFASGDDTFGLLTASLRMFFAHEGPNVTERKPTYPSIALSYEKGEDPIVGRSQDEVFTLAFEIGF